MSGRAAGWFPDPWIPGQHRYWTGEAWTADVFPDGVATPPAPSHVAAADDPASWWSRPAEDGAPPSAPSPVPPVPPQWGTPVADASPLGPPPEVLDTGTARPPGHRRHTAFLALMLVAGLVLGFLAVYSVLRVLDPPGRSSADGAAASPTPSTHGPASQQPGPSTPPSGPAAGVPTPGPTDPITSALRGLVVRQQDVEADRVVAPIDGGDQVAGQVTLDLCNGTFPSEVLRRQRLQVAVYTPTNASVLSTEAVAYTDTAATTRAFQELAKVAASCPPTAVDSPVGETTRVTRFSAPPDRAWPKVATVDRLAYDFTTTGAVGAEERSIAVYLKRGRVLLAVYFPAPEGAQSPVSGRTTVAGIADLFATRLARLPASVTSD